MTPNQGEVEDQQDPAVTDRARSGETLVRAMTVAAEATEAHMRGDIHVHGQFGIARAAPRIRSNLSNGSACIFRYGLAPPPPPTRQPANSVYRGMKRLFVEGARRRGFNELPSPFLHSGADMDRIARLALFGLMTPGGASHTTIELCWRQTNIAACMLAMQFADIWVRSYRRAARRSGASMFALMLMRCATPTFARGYCCSSRMNAAPASQLRSIVASRHPGARLARARDR